MQTYCAKCSATLESPTRDTCPGCGAARPRWGWPEDPRLGERVAGGQYRVLRRIGAGGFGIVYEVETVVGGLRRALKVLSSEWVADDSMRERFVNEALVLERVNHPNVGRCYAAGTLDDEGSLYLLLELVEGPALSRVLEEEGRPLDPRRAVPIARQIASGLVAAHANGVLHRDLKPDNILIAREDAISAQVKVVDFGVAKHMRQGETVTASVVGTPQYMAPEQFTPGVALDARVDVWQLGATLFAMLTGRAPYSGGRADEALMDQHVAHLRAGPKPSSVEPSLLAHGLLDDLVSRMLASDPERRPRSAAEICEALARIEHALAPDSVQTSSLALLETLCAQPSDAAWWSLCRFLQNRSEDQSMLLGVAEQRLRGWPSSLRRAAIGWWEQVKRGERNGLWAIARSLDLSGLPLSDDDVARLSECAACAQLERLSLARCGIGNEAASALARSPYLTNLAHLDLSGNRISSAGVATLAGASNLPNLRSLDLANNGIGTRGAEALAQTGLPLEVLNLSGNDVRKEGAVAIADGDRLRQLRQLSLAHNGLGSDGAAAIATSRCLSLDTLDLSGNALGPSGAAALALTPLARGLKKLVLAQNGFGQQGLELFVTSVRSDALEELDLSSNQIDSSGAMVLGSSPFARRLRRFDLADNQLDDAGLVVLLGAPHLSGLQHLGVAQNAISDAGLKLMSGAPPRLESLDIARNPIGREGVSGLSSALPRTRVTRLSLSGCGLDGEGLASLLRASNGRLQELDVSHNALGADGIELLAQTSELSALRVLDASHTDLGPRGAMRFGASPFLTGLRSLDLASNQLGDEGVSFLARSAAGMPQLERLSLADNRITPKGVGLVAEHAPRLSELDLSFNELGDAGIDALARATMWHNLHRLDLVGCKVGFGGVAVLVSAPSLPFLCSLDLSRNAVAGEIDIHSLGRDKIALLEQTFAIVTERGADVAERFYELLFERHPAVKPLFAKVSMAAQRRHLMSALVMTIETMRQPDLLEAKLFELGKRHVGYGAALTHYFAVSSTLLDVVKEAVGDAWSAEVQDAWFEGLDAITAAMMRAHRSLAHTEVDRGNVATLAS